MTDLVDHVGTVIVNVMINQTRMNKQLYKDLDDLSKIKTADDLIKFAETIKERHREMLLSKPPKVMRIPKFLRWLFPVLGERVDVLNGAVADWWRHGGADEYMRRAERLSPEAASHLLREDVKEVIEQEIRNLHAR